MWIRLLPYAVAAGLLVAVGFWIYGLGYSSCETDHLKAAESARQDQSELADEADKEIKVERSKSEARVRTIYVEKDATGCADSTPPVGVLNSLRDSD